MNRRTVLFLLVVAVGVLICVSAAYIVLSKPSGPEYSPVINPADFGPVVNNTYYPLTPGTTYVYQGVSEDGNEVNEVNVTHATKVVMGVTCIVVWDRVWLEGELVEETYDWYAQDKDGNVWYFGEDSKEYSGGVVVSTEGSWEAGVDGAQPGIIMEANPAIGDAYRQEYYRGEAEDEAEVISLTGSAEVPYGSFSNCLVIKEWTRLEPDIEENKYYASGVGFVREVVTKGGSGYSELVEIRTW